MRPTPPDAKRPADVEASPASPAKRPRPQAGLAVLPHYRFDAAPQDCIQMRLDTAVFTASRKKASELLTIRHVVEDAPHERELVFDQDAETFHELLSAVYRGHRLRKDLCARELAQLKTQEAFFNCPPLRIEIAALYGLRQGVWRHKAEGGPKAAAAYRALAVGLMREGLAQSAQRKLERAQGLHADPSEDLPVWRQATHRSPADPGAWEALAAAHLAAKDPAGQIRALEKACRLEPTAARWFAVGNACATCGKEVPDMDLFCRGKDAFLAGLELLRQAPKTTAFAVAEKKIELGHLLAKACLAHAHKIFASSQDAVNYWRQACDVLEDAGELTPQASIVHARRGAIFEDLGHGLKFWSADLAAQSLTFAAAMHVRAIECADGSDFPTLELYRCHRSLGLWLAKDPTFFRESCGHYQAASQTAQQSSEVTPSQRAALHFDFGRVWERTLADVARGHGPQAGNVGQADIVPMIEAMRAAYQEAVDLEPESENFVAHLAASLVDSDASQALDLLRKAISLDLRQLDVLHILLKLAQKLEALPEEEQVLARRRALLAGAEPEGNEDIFALEKCLVRQGKVQQAIESGRKYYAHTRKSWKQASWPGWLGVLISCRQAQEAKDTLIEALKDSSGGAHSLRINHHQETILACVRIQDTFAERVSLLERACSLSNHVTSLENELQEIKQIWPT